MDKLHKSIIAAVFKLEAHNEYETAKQLLLSYIEVKNAIEKIPKLIVTSEGSRYGTLPLQNQRSNRDLTQSRICFNQKVCTTKTLSSKIYG